MTFLKLIPYSFLSVALLTCSLQAQGAINADRRTQAAETAEQIKALMTNLEARAAEFPEVLMALREGRANIEQADETAAQLIIRLTETTDAMEDGSEFDNAIDGHKEELQSLIDEAESSADDARRSRIPELRKTLHQLDSNDRKRAETVIKARNVIATLEEKRETIGFFIRAGEVIRAAELISTSVAEFDNIIEQAKTVANGIISAATP